MDDNQDGFVWVEYARSYKSITNECRVGDRTAKCRNQCLTLGRVVGINNLDIKLSSFEG